MIFVRVDSDYYSPKNALQMLKLILKMQDTIESGKLNLMKWLVSNLPISTTFFEIKFIYLIIRFSISERRIKQRLSDRHFNDHVSIRI